MFVAHTAAMSTQQGVPYVLSRVAARAGLGLWRHRVTVLVGAIVAVGFGTYVSMNYSGVPAMGLATAGSPNGDCADTAMAAIAM